MSNINNPRHYETKSGQVIEHIAAILSDDQLAGYYRGNVLKYICRYENKGGVEDLEKAKVYLSWLIEHEKTRPHGQ